jgi:hypothetical protein
MLLSLLTLKMDPPLALTQGLSLIATMMLSLCVSQGAREWNGPSNETGKTEASRYSSCGAIKIPPCSKALSAEERSYFAPTPSHNIRII